jgi:hypothetical protein
MPHIDTRSARWRLRGLLDWLDDRDRLLWLAAVDIPLIAAVITLLEVWK